MCNVRFIAEVSSNHNNNLKRCKQFIETAKKMGCDGIKYQLFKIDQLFASEILKKDETLRKRKNWELPLEFIPELSAYAHDLGLEFACTPFYLNAVDELEPYVDFFKIASYELLWHDLLKKCADTGFPIIFSTGMATFTEIKAALNSLVGHKSEDITILHCNSAYPTPIDDANLRVIDTLRNQLSDFENKLNLSFGWSDHTVSPAVIYRAIHHYQVNLIEFHLDLDGKGEEYSSGHCWLPDEIGAVIKDVREGFLADGNCEIGPTESESNEREWRADPSDGLRPLLHTRKQVK